MSFLLFVVLPSVLGALLVFMIARRVEHVAGMQEPELGGLDSLDPDALVTLSGKVEPLDELIPSPVRGDGPVLAWSLETVRGGEREKLSRWAPFVLHRKNDTDVVVQRLLAFDPKRARVTSRIEESSLDPKSLQHLRMQQREAFAQLRQIHAWVLDREPEADPFGADADSEGDPARSYDLSVLRPGDELTIVTRVLRIPSSPGDVPGFFLLPRYAYPLPYDMARSPFHGQGRFVLGLAASTAGVLGALSVVGWLIGLVYR